MVPASSPGAPLPGSPMIASVAPSRLTSASGETAQPKYWPAAPVCCQRTFTGSLKPAFAAAGAASARTAVTASARLSMRRFYAPTASPASMRLRSCDGGTPNAVRKRSVKCDGVQ